MGCRRFENQLMDAALDGLLPEGEAELNAHLRECAACRVEYERKRQLVAAMDRSLEEMAAVEPSPEMVARIHVKIVEQPAPSHGWWLGWWPAAAGALAVAALLAYLMIPSRTAQPGPESPTVATSPGSSQPHLKPAPEMAKAEPPVTARAARKLGRPALVARSETRPAMPEVLVPDDQARAVAWLYQALQQQPRRMNALLAQQAQRNEEAAKPLEIARLSIPPLDIRPLEAASPDEQIRQ